ncbi:MAG: glycosyltransferase family 4 protein [Campylobacterota bacterium]|nr:glycosyltransferase family 4 protein [Campylobacterota bacterium]
MQTKITHLTSAHPRYDTRIFIKMCSSLAKIENYKVSLVVADGKGDESKNDVDIVDIGAKSGGRISRMTTTVKKVYEKAKELNSDIYHLHDPELIPIGLKLKKLGAKVIFDAHEDLPKQILGKHYLNRFTKTILSKSVSFYEKYSLRKFDYIITATPYIRDKFLKINTNSEDINNFPILDELLSDVEYKNRKNQICYIGALTQERGIKEIVKSMEYDLDTSLVIAGKFFDKNIEDEVKNYKGWEKVDFKGFVGRDEVKKILENSKIGLVTLYPIINYLDALPVKMFEYMASGVPVVSSDIELWKDIVNYTKCGLCVNPLEPKEIAKAIEYILTNSKEAEKMGQNGKKAVIEKYNWGVEENKLFNVYELVLKN